jgi:RHH-type rel operon transcriptional repressor/antitoxin RelB
MQRAANISFRVESEFKERIDRLAEAMERPRSYIIERALSSFLDSNEWQVEATTKAVELADSPAAKWIDHESVESKWKARLED